MKSFLINLNDRSNFAINKQFPSNLRKIRFETQLSTPFFLSFFRNNSTNSSRSIRNLETRVQLGISFSRCCFRKGAKTAVIN